MRNRVKRGSIQCDNLVLVQLSLFPRLLPSALSCCSLHLTSLSGTSTYLTLHLSRPLSTSSTPSPTLIIFREFPASPPPTTSRAVARDTQERVDQTTLLDPGRLGSVGETVDHCERFRGSSGRSTSAAPRREGRSGVKRTGVDVTVAAELGNEARTALLDDSQTHLLLPPAEPPFTMPDDFEAFVNLAMQGLTSLPTSKKRSSLTPAYWPRSVRRLSRLSRRSRRR